MLDETLELIHAARTGDFPEAGPLREQSERVRRRFAIVQQAVLAQDRIAATKGML